MEKEESVQHFLDLIKQSRRGKFKVYIGMIAGVGKTFRMLQEAHQLLDSGVDVQVGYVETHGEDFLQGERIGRDGFAGYLAFTSRNRNCR